MQEEQRERLRRQRRERAERATYETGYGKPPSATRFSSINQPQKARKSRKSRGESAAEIADEMISVKINGVLRRISRYEAILLKLANEAASGHIQAMRLWFDHISNKEATGLQDYPKIDYAADVLRKIDAMAAAREANRDKTIPEANLSIESSDAADKEQPS